MDYRFKFRRGKPSPGEKAEEQRSERDILVRMRGLAYGLSIPVSLASGPIAGWLLGSWLDKLLGTGYWEIVLIILGTIAGFMMTIEMLIKLGRQP